MDWQARSNTESEFISRGIELRSLVGPRAATSTPSQRSTRVLVGAADHAQYQLSLDRLAFTAEGSGGLQLHCCVRSRRQHESHGGRRSRRLEGLTRHVRGVVEGVHGLEI